MTLKNNYIHTLTSLGLICSSAAFAADKTTYLIKFEDAAYMEYDGSIAGYKATNPQINGQKKPDFKSQSSIDYLDFLQKQQNLHLDHIKAVLNRDVDYKYQYKVAQNGAAIDLYPQEVSMIANLPGIVAIKQDEIYELDTDAGPQFIGASSAWDGSSMPDSLPNKGEGMVIGVLDTGINSDHISFSETSEDGYDFAAANPLGADTFLGACAGISPTMTCNNKLIGMYDFSNDSANGAPEDNNGHGSHTASTVAGNTISAPPGGFVETGSSNTLDAPSISGVAPHAHIIAYDVCVSNCSSSAISGAIDQAILDGVDVISFSISGGTSPWNQFDNDRTFLNATNAGIVVVTSAGNTSTTITDPIAAVNHKGPWLLSVANSTHNRINSNDVDITGPGTVPAILTGMYGLLGAANNFGNSVVSEDIIYAGEVDSGNFEGCNAWPANTFNNAVALISRGTCNFSDKINNAATAGAEAVIVFNNQSAIPIPMGGIESTTIPALMVGLTDGQNMVDFIANAVTTATVEILNEPVYKLFDAAGNILASSSLRGPNLTFDVTKPDINGPGTNIFAAYEDSVGAAPQFSFLSGTSMSAPHVSGAAALVIKANPTWTPTEVKSAMMMTADATTNKKDNGSDVADADDVGSGTVDLTKAAMAGLVMDETFANFLAADPANGGDPKTLNIPSMRNSSCTADCSWTRTLRYTQDTVTEWDITPITDGTFNLEVSPSYINSRDVIFIDTYEDPIALSDQRTIDEVTITVTASGVPDIEGGMAFGEILLIERNGDAPDARITVTVNQNNPSF